VIAVLIIKGDSCTLDKGLEYVPGEGFRGRGRGRDDVVGGVALGGVGQTTTLALRGLGSPALSLSLSKHPACTGRIHETYHNGMKY
jgi:hypothetical protein